MPDRDLAEFVKGESGRDKKAPAVKSCPFCSAELLPRAQKCKFCGSWVVSTGQLGLEWRNEPASPGQLTLLKNLNMPCARGLTRGVAADRLRAAHLQSPASFEALAGEGHSPERSFSAMPLVAAAAVLVLATGVYGLYSTGKLESLLEGISGRVDSNDIPVGDMSESTEADATVLEHEPSSADVKGYGTHGRLSGTTSGEEAHDRKPTTEITGDGAPESSEDLAEMYRSRFKEMPAGTRLKLVTVAGAPIEGVLKEVTPEYVCLVKQVGADKAEVNVNRINLAARSRAALYESDYVAYMVEHHSLIEEREHRAEEVAARLRQEEAERARKYEAWQEARRDRVETARSSVQEQAVSKEAARALESGEMSMREWMEANGPSDALKARRERVRAHEQNNPEM